MLGSPGASTMTLRLLIEHLPSVQITPLEYATRAHEILEDAQRDLLSGADVPWSHEGLLATAAGLTPHVEVLATLQPLLDGREGTIETVDFSLRRFSARSPRSGARTTGACRAGS